MRTRGFTLLELSIVIGLIGVLVALTAPAFRPYLLRARAAEAPAMLESIAHAQLAWYRDHGTFLACAPSADTPPRGTVGSFDASRPGWSELGFRADGNVRFTYEVVLDGDSFKAIARGDLDGDGHPSIWTLDGRTLQITSTQELE